MSTKDSVLDELSLELAVIKDKYSLCSAEVLVKQTELDELSSTFKEQVKRSTEHLQLANQNTERVTAEMQQQAESSTDQIQVAEESIRNLKEKVAEITGSLEEQRHLKETEAGYKYILKIKIKFCTSVCPE